MSDSSIVIIQGTVGLYTVATRCHTCFAVTLKVIFISFERLNSTGDRWHFFRKNVLSQYEWEFIMLGKLELMLYENIIRWQ